MLLSNKLEILNPLSTLNRGYSVTYINDNVLSNIKNININDCIKIKIKNGKIEAKVTNIVEE